MFQPALLSWYDSHARTLPWREEPSPYRVWVSEIMLQQTRVDTVIPFFERFMQNAPTLDILASLPEEKLLKLWEGLGYYSRVRNLQKAAQVILKDFDGRIPSVPDELQALPGIGPYTAGAIASIAYGYPVPAIDGNVLRVMSRLYLDDGDVSSPKFRKRHQEALQGLIPPERAGAFNQALMELGALVCLPRQQARCPQCPVRDYCAAYAQGKVEALPVKPSKKERKIELRTVLLVCRRGKFALRQRPESGLLPSLWEFPHIEGEWPGESCEDELLSMGLCAESIKPLPAARHIFSHLEWHMQGYLISVPPHTDIPGWIWASPEEIRRQYSIPSAFKNYRAIALEWDAEPPNRHEKEKFGHK